MILAQHMGSSISWWVIAAAFTLPLAYLPLTALADETRNRLDPETTVMAGSAGERESTTPPKTVVAHWRFQNSTRGSVARPSHLIPDSSGHYHHGRAIGGPTYRSVKLPDNNLVLVFDGHDDRVFIADDPSFHLTKSFTLEAYVQVDLYPNNPAKLSQILFRGDDRGGFDPWYLAVTESGQLAFLIADALNHASVVLSPQPILPGKWIHVAGVLDHETGQQNLFLNGERVATTQTKIRSFGTIGGDHPGIAIGSLQSGGQAFRGSIGAVRISSSALTRDGFLAATASTQ